MNHNERSQMVTGWIFFALFAIFIALGIYVKRGLGHPEFMMMFHLPAAVFLVLAGQRITYKIKKAYSLAIEKNKTHP